MKGGRSGASETSESSSGDGAADVERGVLEESERDEDPESAERSKTRGEGERRGEEEKARTQVLLKHSQRRSICRRGERRISRSSKSWIEREKIDLHQFESLSLLLGLPKAFPTEVLAKKQERKKGRVGFP